MPVALQYTWTVDQLFPDSSSGGGLIPGAYFVEEGSYTVFKDAGHKATAAYKTDWVVRIERSAEPLDDAS